MARAGKTASVRVRGGECGRAGPGRGCGYWNSMEREASMFKLAKHLANAWGEMSHVCGILSRRSSTMPLEPKRNLGSEGNRMPASQTFCRRGASPPKNPSGRLGAAASHDCTRRYV